MPQNRSSGYPGQYLNRHSFVHRLPAEIKVVTALGLSFSTFFLSTGFGTAVSILVCAALYIASHLGWKALSQDCTLVAWQAPLVFAVYLCRHGWNGFAAALLISARLALFSLPTLWLQRTTQLNAVFVRLFPERVAFLLAMSLRFVPLLARDARDIYWLQRLRGARLGPRDLMNPMNWREACHCMALPLLIRAFHLTDHAAVAAKQRGIGGVAVTPARARSVGE
jgi:energy-coupling factor transport system permease protein